MEGFSNKSVVNWSQNVSTNYACQWFTAETRMSEEDPTYFCHSNYGHYRITKFDSEMDTSIVWLWVVLSHKNDTKMSGKISAERKKKKIVTQTGFEPVASELKVGDATDWATNTWCSKVMKLIDLNLRMVLFNNFWLKNNDGFSLWL